MPKLSSLITPKSRAEFEQEFPPIPQDIYQPSRPITNDSVMGGGGQNYIINETTGRQTILPPSMQQMQLSGGRTGYLDPRRQEVIMDTDVGQMAVPLAQIQANDRALQQQQEMANLQRQAQMHQLRVQAGLVPKEAEKPQFVADLGGYVIPPSPDNPQGRFIPLTGAPKGTGMPKLTEGQAKATTFASQMAAASNELNKLEAKGFDPTSKATQIQTSLAGGFGNVLTSPQAQQAKQTQNQWSEAFLRVKTGAAATQPEVELNNKTFFPQIGDSPDVIEQKRQMRIQAEQDVLNMTGPGRELATRREQPQQPGGKQMSSPKVGEVMDGHIFLGGNPADPSRWRRQ